MENLKQRLAEKRKQAEYIESLRRKIKTLEAENAAIKDRLRELEKENG